MICTGGVVCRFGMIVFNDLLCDFVGAEIKAPVLTLNIFKLKL